MPTRKCLFFCVDVFVCVSFAKEDLNVRIIMYLCVCVCVCVRVVCVSVCVQVLLASRFG